LPVPVASNQWEKGVSHRGHRGHGGGFWVGGEGDPSERRGFGARNQASRGKHRTEVTEATEEDFGLVVKGPQVNGVA
jgi:hypothetical protein